MNKPRLHARAAFTALLLAAATCARADVRTGSQPDLLFVLWDSSARAAYTLDLGIDANSFWAYAQQDAGYSWTYTLPATDPRLVAFRAASSTLANQNWAVVGVQSNSGSATPGDNKVYTTLRQGPGDGTLNPNYVDLTGMDSAAFLGTTQRASSRWFRDLNSLGGGDDAAMNTHASTANGSAFHRGTSPRYFANNATFYAKLNPGADGSFYGGMFDVGNAVNKSSWFYAVSNSASGNVVVDEFDNLSSNGYWGLALTSSNTYLLTFTQVAAKSGATSATTDAGMLRVSSTDYVAGLGEARLIGLAGTVSAVPESGTSALLIAGLAALGVRRRRGTAA